MEKNRNKYLCVAALAHGEGGKSTTWYTLFGRRVGVGWHMLPLSDTEEVRVFLVNGSCAERKRKRFRTSTMKDVIGGDTPYILLCSLGYCPAVTGQGKRCPYCRRYGPFCPADKDTCPGDKHTIQFLREERNYYFYVHWLNPGYSDSGEYEDCLSLLPLMADRGVILKKNGKIDPVSRVEEMRQVIYEHASRWKLLLPRPVLYA